VEFVLHTRLLKLRKENKLTQLELSSRLGIARTTYSGYELGTSEPDNETLEKIADFYKVTTDNLLGREEHIVEETQLDRDKKYALDLIMSITDPDKKKAAMEYLKFLAGEK
jgi:transcriptional regulator with XRE-family HTH domain